MYRFALSPKWIFGHLLAASLVVSFVAAGFWQLSRHEWRSDLNDRIEAQANLETLGIDGIAAGAPDELDLRVAEVAGTWADNDILIWNRSLGGQPGCHIVTPLVFDETSPGSPEAIVVNRGWLDLAQCEVFDPAVVRPETAEAVVAGQLRSTQLPGRFQASDPASGVLETMLRVDVERIDQQVAEDLAPVYLTLSASAPAEAKLVALPPQPTNAGPHLGYAVQWFLFALVGIVGYPLVLRKQATSPELISNTAEST